MASDGGPMYPARMGNVHDGISVRDGFAMVCVQEWIKRLPEHRMTESASWVYGLAQAMTDEKLRRDKADHDEGKAG